jgi:NADH:ubiquinone oxidoreductase subunit F (NADH-binding)/NAD-dependent dihydropyrimidine dehydrogenase PreA subunit/(2Fe-2S) ferredoxin
MDFDDLYAQAQRDWLRLEHSPQPLIQIGTGTCGKASGADQVMQSVQKTLKEIQVLTRTMEVGCIGMCYLEPLMTIRTRHRPPIMYGKLSPAAAAKIVSRSLLDGDPCLEWSICALGDGAIEGVPRLEDHPMMRNQRRIALRNCGLIDPSNINHYIARGGYQGLNRALRMDGAEVAELIGRAGLRGRGGAGFPTGLKWELTRKQKPKDKYIVCNADEGDPGAFMDRALLEGDPHSVLEGMLIGAHAIGAAEGFIYVRAEYPLAIERLEKAMEQMRRCNLLGSSILGSRFNFSLSIQAGAGAFVCGEETALMASLQGSRGLPAPKPPYPAQSGLWDKPTCINNVETFSNVSAILAHGAEWYASIGTEKSKGTKTFSLAGKIVRTGLIEVPMGTPLREIVYDMGGGAPGGKEIKGIQTGGPSGGCIPASLFDLSVDYESLTAAGSIMGSGGLVVMDRHTCMVDVARYFLSFTQAESCGKCVPCRLGTHQMLRILEEICAGRGIPEHLELLRNLSETVQKGSLCGLGQTAPNPVQTALRYFLDEFDRHISAGKCDAGVCAPLFHYEINPQLCNGCGLCVQKCSEDAVSGERKKPHTIDQTRCIKCGLCFQSCIQQAIEIC